jgi:hypothetical protein
MSLFESPKVRNRTNIRTHVYNFETSNGHKSSNQKFMTFGDKRVEINPEVSHGLLLILLKSLK